MMQIFRDLQIVGEQLTPDRDRNMVRAQRLLLRCGIRFGQITHSIVMIELLVFEYWMPILKFFIVRLCVQFFIVNFLFPFLICLQPVKYWWSGFHRP